MTTSSFVHVAGRRALAVLMLCACGGEAGEAAGQAASTSEAASTTNPTTGAPTTGQTGTTGDDDPCDDSPQALADCVDAAAWQDDLQFIADIRTPGTPHWQAVQDLCADRLTDLGYDVDLQDYGTGINVVGRRAGAVSPDEIVLVGAHYDHIADCQGADDNATGIAAVLEIARLLARIDAPARTVHIACWDEEESGLVGSEAYVAAAVSAGWDIRVDFNFDMIGVRSAAPNSQSVPPGFELVFADAYADLEASEFRGDFVAAIASAATHDFALDFAAAADRIALRQTILEIPAGGENTDLFGDLRRSDHASFWAAGFPALFITDTGEFRNDHYHCGAGPDVLADIDVDFGAAITRATVEAGAIAVGM